MRGAQLEAALTGSDGTEQFWTLSYGRFKETHTEISIDGGENWFLAAKEEYTRKDG